MSAATNPFDISPSPGQGSREAVSSQGSNEFVFSVVGYTGSGTSAVAKLLKSLFIERELEGHKFDVEILRARDAIKAWAVKNGSPTPSQSEGKRKLAEVTGYQDLGDEMRLEDHSAVAKELVELIRLRRAEWTGADVEHGQPVKPDGKPRVYILDSIRHPAEVELLRHVYRDAFVLIGVVCDETERLARIVKKFSDAGEDDAKEFMSRDADDGKLYGQRVAKAFHLADFFVDNSTKRVALNKPNPDWILSEDLSRLVKIVTHSELIRPELPETAMYHAFNAKMQSACLSRQVGAAIVDVGGTVVATGTNEVARAGGGVYGESAPTDGSENRDFRCGMYPGGPDNRYCRNSRTQSEIIDELINSISKVTSLDAEKRSKIEQLLHRSKIGQLLEFSRAIHAEMDAVLSAARKGASVVGARLFVTTYPCHYCARHLVSAGIDEVQYIEPYPKSLALDLHEDAITTSQDGWKPPSQKGPKVLFRPFTGVAPGLYRRAFLKDRDLKQGREGNMNIGSPEWTTAWHLPRIDYTQLEAKLMGGDSSNE